MMKIKRARWWSLIPIGLVGIITSVLLVDRHSMQEGSGRVLLSSTAAQTAESWWYDFKMKYRPARNFAPVTVAAIDDASLERFGRWPWSRGIFAELIETLYEAGAKSVVFDVVFSEPEYKSRELEKTLQVPIPGRNQSIEQILKLRPKQIKELATWLPEIGDQYLGQSVWNHADTTVLGYFWKPERECHIMNNDDANRVDASALGYLSHQTWVNHVELILKHGFRLSSARDFLPHDFSRGGLGPLQLCPTINRGAVGALARRQGYFNADSDADGVFRKSNLLLPFLFREGEHEGLYVFPSLALSAVMSDLGADTISIDWLDYPNLRLKSISIIKEDRRWELPLRRDGSVLIDFALRGKTRVPSVSLARAGNWSDTEKALIQNKIVMIGPTSTGVFDLRPNPVDPHGAGVFLHAATTAQMLDSFYTQGEYFGLKAISTNQQIVVLWTFLVMLAISLISSRRALIAGVWWPAIFGVALVDIALFRAGWVSDFALIASGWIFTLAVVTLLLYLLEERDRIFIKQAFARYVSPEVVRQIEENPKSLNLYGERKEISVLFADIRGFTSVSEALSPDELRILLGDYFKPMTGIIQNQQGTVDKFIGDAIMALFGAPLPLASHARAAVEAALQMQTAISRLRDQDARFAKFDLKIGVAVASGWASVGNMGTDTIFTYTALGDVVNLASRLENLTKSYGLGILISDSTYHALDVAKQGEWRLVDLVRVIGKGQTVGIYGPCLDAELKATYEKAFELYQGRQWTLAQALFAAMAPRDAASLHMARRCELAGAEGVDADWDGVWNFDHK